MKGKSLSSVRLLPTPWTTAYQAPPSMGFSRQESWSGVPLPSPLTNSTNSQTNRSLQPVSPACGWPWFGLMLITTAAHLLSLNDSTKLYPWQSRRCLQYPNSPSLCACVCVCVCVCARTCTGSHVAKTVGGRNFQPSQIWPSVLFYFGLWNKLYF